MVRTSLVCGLAIALVSAAPVEPAKLPAPKPSVNLAEKLRSRVRFEGFDDPKTTLADALAMFSNRWELSFVINERAFKFDNVLDVRLTPIADPAPVPRMDARIDVILQKVLSRVPAGTSAVFLVRENNIELTTGQMLINEIEKGTAPHLVHQDFENRPLSEALRELAKDADANVVLDPRVAKDDKLPSITARLHNVAVGTAVRLVAEMGGLQMVRIENVYFVTTTETAAKLRKEEETRKKEPPLQLIFGGTPPE